MIRVRKVYKKYYGFNSRPFSNTPTEAMFYRSNGRGDTIDAIVSLLLHGDAIIKIVGEVGAGKTTLVRNLIARLEKEGGWNIAYVPNPTMGPLDMLKSIYEDLGGLNKGLDAEHALYKEIYHLALDGVRAHRKTLIVIDEAHHAPVETLERVRLLANLEHSENNIVQVVLAGQLELEDVLHKPEMKALASRISHSFTIGPLGKQEAVDYLNYRASRAGYEGVLFSEEVAQSIWEASGTGTPRRLNIVADKTLIVAAANGASKPAVEHVEQVENELLKGSTGFIQTQGDEPAKESERSKRTSRFFHALVLFVLAFAVTLFVLAGAPFERAYDVSSVSSEIETKPVTAPPVSDKSEANAVEHAAPPERVSVESDAMPVANRAVSKEEGSLSNYMIHVATVSSELAKRQTVDALKAAFEEKTIIARKLDTGRTGIFIIGFDEYLSAHKAVDSIPDSLRHNKPYVIDRDYFEKITVKQEM